MAERAPSARLHLQKEHANREPHALNQHPPRMTAPSAMSALHSRTCMQMFCLCMLGAHMGVAAACSMRGCSHRHLPRRCRRADLCRHTVRHWPVSRECTCRTMEDVREVQQWVQQGQAAATQRLWIRDPMTSQRLASFAHIQCEYSQQTCGPRKKSTSAPSKVTPLAENRAPCAHSDCHMTLPGTVTRESRVSSLCCQTSRHHRSLTAARFALMLVARPPHSQRGPPQAPSGQMPRLSVHLTAIWRVLKTSMLMSDSNHP